MLKNIIILNTIFNDAPGFAASFSAFQDSVAPSFTGIIELHNTIFFYLVVISVGVFWVLSSVIYYYNSKKSPIIRKLLNSGTTTKLILTITPAFILISISLSFLFNLEISNFISFSNLSFISVMKLIFILILVFINIYVFYMDSYINKCNNFVPPLKTAGIIDIQLIRNLKKIGTVSVGAATLYSTDLAYRSYKYAKAAETKIEALKVEVQESKGIMEEIKKEFLEFKNLISKQNNINTIQNKTYELDNTILVWQSKIEKSELEIDKLINLLKQINKQPSEQKSISELIEQQTKNAFLSRKEAQDAFNNVKSKTEEIKTDIEMIDIDENILKSSVISSEFIDKLMEKFESFDHFQKLAVTLLFFNYAVVNSVISIVYIFYGDILIEKFNLESRFPKLSKIIHLRKKFQNYYLLLSISVILFVSALELLFAISVLTI